MKLDSIEVVRDLSSDLIEDLLNYVEEKIGVTMSEEDGDVIFNSIFDTLEKYCTTGE